MAEPSSVDRETVTVLSKDPCVITAQTSTDPTFSGTVYAKFTNSIVTSAQCEMLVKCVSVLFTS